jgi:tRNA (guanine37-N1)-methyltransferase
MRITILTLFPEMFAGPFDHSIIKRAKEKGLVEIEFVNIRDFGEGPHKIVDDTPYGGGIGMVMRVDVLHKAIEYAKSSVILSEAKNLKDPSPPAGGSG